MWQGQAGHEDGWNWHKAYKTERGAPQCVLQCRPTSPESCKYHRCLCIPIPHPHDTCRRTLITAPCLCRWQPDWGAGQAAPTAGAWAWWPAAQQQLSTWGGDSTSGRHRFSGQCQGWESTAGHAGAEAGAAPPHLAHQAAPTTAAAARPWPLFSVCAVQPLVCHTQTAAPA